MGNKHRLFVALPITPTLQEKVFAWARAYESLPVRWLTGKNLHITLIPPWYEADIEYVQKQLQKLSWDKGSLSLAFRRVLYGPNPREPRLIWAQGETPPELGELKDKFEQILDIESEKRPLKLHLTLARFRPENFSKFRIKHLDDPVTWDEEVHEVVLMESHLARSGADYEILAHIPLT